MAPRYWSLPSTVTSCIEDIHNISMLHPRSFSPYRDGSMPEDDNDRRWSEPAKGPVLVPPMSIVPELVRHMVTITEG